MSTAASHEVVTQSPSRKRAGRIADGEDEGTTVDETAMAPPPSKRPTQLKRTDSTTITSASVASDKAIARKGAAAAADDDDDSASTASFVGDRVHRPDAALDEDEDDAQDDEASETTATTSTTLSDASFRQYATTEDINAVADEEGVPKLEDDKLYELTLGGDTLMKFLGVVKGRASKSGESEPETAFMIKELKGKLYLFFKAHILPAAYMCHCKIQSMRVAADATVEPFSLHTNKIVSIFASSQPTNMFIMTVYRHAPSMMVIRERDPEEGMHGEIAVQIPIHAPSEELLCEPPLIENSHSIPFTRGDLGKIASTALRIGAPVRFCIYEIMDKAVLLVKLVNPKDESTVITYTYMMSVRHVENSRTTTLVADTASAEIEAQMVRLLKTAKPIVDDSFDAAALKSLTYLPSTGNNICLFIGGDTDQDMKQPLVMVTHYGSNVTFGVIIMSNTEIGEEEE